MIIHSFNVGKNQIDVLAIDKNNELVFQNENGTRMTLDVLTGEFDGVKGGTQVYDALYQWYNHFKSDVIDMYQEGQYERLPNYQPNVIDNFDISVQLDETIGYWCVELNGQTVLECLSNEEMKQLRLSDILKSMDY